MHSAKPRPRRDLDAAEKRRFDPVGRSGPRRSAPSRGGQDSASADTGREILVAIRPFLLPILEDVRADSSPEVHGRRDDRGNEQEGTAVQAISEVEGFGCGVAGGSALKFTGCTPLNPGLAVTWTRSKNEGLTPLAPLRRLSKPSNRYADGLNVRPVAG